MRKVLSAAIGVALLFTVSPAMADDPEWGQIPAERVLCNSRAVTGIVYKPFIIITSKGLTTGYDGNTHYIWSKTISVKMGTLPWIKYDAVVTGIQKDTDTCLKEQITLNVPYTGAKRVKIRMTDPTGTEKSTSYFYNVKPGKKLGIL